MNSVWYPANSRNRIYRGDFNTNGITDAPDYWVMTSKPTANDGCAGFPDGAYPDTSHRMWQQTMATNNIHETRNVTGLSSLNDGCVVFTSFGMHNNCCDSGTPVIRAGDLTTLNGILGDFNANFGAPDEGTKSNTGTNGNPALGFRPLYEGLADLDAYFETHSTNTGAFLCINSACTE